MHNKITVGQGVLTIIALCVFLSCEARSAEFRQHYCERAEDEFSVTFRSVTSARTITFYLGSDRFSIRTPTSKGILNLDRLDKIELADAGDGSSGFSIKYYPASDSVQTEYIQFGIIQPNCLSLLKGFLGERVRIVETGKIKPP